MPLLTSLTSVRDLLGEGGRLNYRVLTLLARDITEQAFIRLLGHWVLVGESVLRGKITPSTSSAIETVRFEPDALDQAPSYSSHLAEVVYVFYKPDLAVDGVQSFTVGRIDENDFVLPDYAISRTQAVIHVTRGNRFRLRSLGGSNPVYVNNRPIDQETTLREGDFVGFGRFRFLLLAPSALYLRLQGIKPQVWIRQLVNALGQANYKALKEYAVKHDEDIFTQLMRHPSLVGSGVFRGYGIRSSGPNPEITQGFLPDITDGPNAMQLKVMGRSIYPLIRPERSEENGEETLTVGRGLENDIMMGDEAISTRHAKVRFGEAGQYFLQDLQSTNGVVVNGHELGNREQELFDGDKVKIGRHEFTLMFPSLLYHHLLKGSG
ncbi:MAG: FHA domain-containing protein [Magnetococcus sp. YQC-5]